MAHLSHRVKVFIVQALASYETPAEVVELVNQEFGIRISRQRVQAYDPTAAAGQRLSSELRELFQRTREAVRQDLARIPIAHQAYRLRVLDRMVRKAELVGNVVLALQLLEQAAKEIGGVYERGERSRGGEGREPTAVLVARVAAAYPSAAPPATST